MRAVRLLVLLLCALAASAPAAAQPAEAPAAPEAEAAFEEGLRQFRAGHFERAGEDFRRAAEDFGFHRRTTAALLMAGKARYASGDLEGAASAMTRFLARYGSSRYAQEARRLRRRAQDRLAGRHEASGAPREVFELGITLPLEGEDLVFAQALFNGIRLAVEEHNAAEPERPVRMVFRASGGEPVGAEAAVAALARAGVDLVLGPLYSEEAHAAARAAERERLVLIAPLATDAGIAAGRRFVFQANPTFEVRGRAMGAYAASNVPGPYGVVAVSGSLGETMAEAFREEAEARGREVAFLERLPSPEAWFQLAERLGPERLAVVGALYLPVTGASAPDQAAGALRGLDRMLGPEATYPRLLANAEWHHLGSGREAAARYGTVYTHDFYVDPADRAAEAFAARYRALSGVGPDRLAYAGYDLTRMVLASLAERRPEEPLPELLRRVRPYQGLGLRLAFGRDNVNEGLFLLRYRDGQSELVE